MRNTLNISEKLPPDANFTPRRRRFCVATDLGAPSVQPFLSNGWETTNADLPVKEKTLSARSRLQAADQEFPLVDHFRGKMVVQIDEKPFMRNHFLSPGAAVHLH